MKRGAARSIMVTAIVAAGLLFGAASRSIAGQSTKYGVKVTVEKNVDFSRLKTYSWTPSQPAPVKAVDDRIVGDVDRELSGLGLAKSESGTGDVLVTYSALRPEGAVGTLVVGFLDPHTRKRLLQLRADKPLETDAAGLDAAIDRLVAELFEQYPTRTAR